jgi:hypothetical protein
MDIVLSKMSAMYGEGEHKQKHITANAPSPNVGAPAEQSKEKYEYP